MAPLDWRGCWWERSREYPVPRLSVFALARRHRALVAAVGSAGAVAVPVARGGVLIASRAIRLRRLEEALGGQAGGSREARGLVVLAGKDLHDPAGDCREFRVLGRTMPLKEPSYVTPQTACDPG